MIIYNNNTKYKGKNRRLRDSIISLQIKYEKDITRSAAKKIRVLQKQNAKSAAASAAVNRV